MVRTKRIEQLRAARPTILPSLLRCDFGNLEAEVRRFEEAGVEGLHVDVMDGHFVPNLSIGFPILATLRRLTDLTLDVHLMISNPGEYVDRYAEAGADSITVHGEVLPDPRPLLEQIHSLGVGAGLSINPATPAESIVDFAPYCDLILVMSVAPGFGGQSFEPVALEKLRWLRERVPAEVLLEVDGGVNAETIAACTAAGADLLVVGSAITDEPDYAATVAELNQLAAEGVAAESPGINPL
jgi:ribulose-phosphate 3-epimerase